MALNAFIKSPLIKTGIRINSERVLGQFFPRYSSSILNGEKEDVSVALADKKQIEYFQKLKTTEITIEEPNLLSTVSGVPPEHVQGRRVRIYKQAKNAMQSGTNDTHKWKLDFENRERWENPLMGWTSTGDPLSNLNLWFTNKEDAIDYCERQGYHYEIDEPQPRRNLKKLYADNFSWSKRTRVGSK